MCSISILHLYIMSVNNVSYLPLLVLPDKPHCVLASCNISRVITHKWQERTQAIFQFTQCIFTDVLQECCKSAPADILLSKVESIGTGVHEIILEDIVRSNDSLWPMHWFPEFFDMIDGVPVIYRIFLKTDWLGRVWRPVYKLHLFHQWSYFGQVYAGWKMNKIISLINVFCIRAANLSKIPSVIWLEMSGNCLALKSTGNCGNALKNDYKFNLAR